MRRICELASCAPQSRGDDRAPSGARRRARTWATWTPNPSPPFGSNNLDDCFQMSADPERPCGASASLPPALLGHEGDGRAPSGARRRARICTTWTSSISPPFGSNHLVVGGFLDEHDRDAVDDGVAEAAGLAVEGLAVGGQLDLLLAL